MTKLTIMTPGGGTEGSHSKNYKKFKFEIDTVVKSYKKSDPKSKYYYSGAGVVRAEVGRNTKKPLNSRVYRHPEFKFIERFERGDFHGA